MLSVEISKDEEKKLEDLAKKTGKTKDYYIRKAIHEFLEDLEDYNLAVERLETIEETYTLAEVEAELGLAD
ncbi:MAG: ribbon-helix-helix protein, CopG family [Alphaproteobacteria bacterium]|nr:ribbon-helix-helix protein, CopG family [Alphaproteobacteria bacterium]NDE19674.1 ribbon-helix-helix protein, CopG family [Alphaproteobacteria bacterium]